VPADPITITDAGELSPSDPSLSETVVAPDGDPYEDYPEDDSRDTQDPAVALEAARLLRELGTARWKDGAGADALTKWQKALRYLDLHNDLPDHTPSELADQFNALRTPLLLNSALAALKAPGGIPGARIVLSATTSVLGLPKLGDADRGTYMLRTLSYCTSNRFLSCRRATSAAKALYRQGLAQVTLKEYEEAEKVFLEAISLAKDDKAIAAELEHLRQRKKAQRDKEKAAYKKIFE
jgi:peptidyl-prolyl isomerase D